MIDWLFRNRATGRITLAQFPNWSIALFGVCTLVRRLLGPTGAAGTALVVVGTGALIWWAADEIVRGVNPWRRMLGGVVMAATGWGLLVN
ncbi:hypothetical protein BH23ACT2_BH23ACT2_00040 [soil metagenome]